jgi:hypothetical protein
MENILVAGANGPGKNGTSFNGITDFNLAMVRKEAQQAYFKDKKY